MYILYLTVRAFFNAWSLLEYTYIYNITYPFVLVLMLFKSCSGWMAAWIDRQIDRLIDRLDDVK